MRNFEIYNKPQTEYVATFLGTANLILGVINQGVFEAENIDFQISEEFHFKNGQSVKLVFRPEDVFLRQPENLTQNYQKLVDGWIEEINFIGYFERIIVRLNFKNGQTIIVTRPKSETELNRLEIGKKVEVGLVRYRLLPNFTLAGEKAAKIL